MAFAPLRESRRRGMCPSNDITVSVLGKKTGNNAQASVSIPREILRECGLPDFPGAYLDILVGQGPDRGSIALIKGSRHKISSVGAGAHRVAVRSALLATIRYPTKSCTYEVGNKQLIILLPADFPVAPDAAAAPVAKPNGGTLHHTAEGVAA